MVEVPITIACGNYDRTRAIRDGRVKVEGCAATYLPLYPEELFFRAFRYQEFDVSELSFSSFIRTVAAGNSTYIGIPAFVSRIFRHSGIYTRADAGIRSPADLGRHRPDMLHIGLVLGVRHREELRRVGQHRTADHGRHHDCLSLSGQNIPQTAQQQAQPRARDGSPPQA